MGLDVLFEGEEKNQLLIIECMSEEESDGEDELVVARPSWRTAEVTSHLKNEDSI